MDYAEAMTALGAAARFGIHPSLDGIRALTAALGDPQDAFTSVQVTGTNGKSSVTRVIEALLVAEGLVAGAYTSPHLESYTERVEIGGAPVSEGGLARALTVAFDAADRSGGRDAFTEFELLTAAAMWLLRDKCVEVACLEVGMGGRWDSTSVVSPAVAVVTGVALDHTERLGPTPRHIAADKAYVIKPGATVVLGPATNAVADVFLDRAREVGSRVVAAAGEGEPSAVAEADTVRFRVDAAPHAVGEPLAMTVRGLFAEYGELTLIAPAYQAANAACAVASAEQVLGRALTTAPMRGALRTVTFPGRFEVLRAAPPLVIDGAHNPNAAAALAAAIAEAWPEPEARPVCVLGVLAGKDAAGIAAVLAPVTRGFVVTRPDASRALAAGELAQVVSANGGAVLAVAGSVAEAVETAADLSAEHGVVVAGSLYTAGEARRAYGHRT